MLLRLVNVISSNVIDSTVRLVKGIFRIRDIGQFFKGYWDIGGFLLLLLLLLLFWDMGCLNFLGDTTFLKKKINKVK